MNFLRDLKGKKKKTQRRRTTLQVFLIPVIRYTRFNNWYLHQESFAKIIVSVLLLCSARGCVNIISHIRYSELCYENMKFFVNTVESIDGVPRGGVERTLRRYTTCIPCVCSARNTSFNVSAFFNIEAKITRIPQKI